MGRRRGGHAAGLTNGHAHRRTQGLDGQELEANLCICANNFAVTGVAAAFSFHVVWR